jgi:ribosomal protein S18 acetylase RimI-like enzyme
MEIVRADESRLDELEPLFVAMHEHHRAGEPGAARVRALRPAGDAWARRREHYRSLFAGGRAHLFLALEGERVIGYAMVSEIGSQATLQVGDRMAELESLSVLPGERGAGVGTALMAAVHALLGELGIEELMLYVMDGNEGALRFYERYGMRPYLHVMLGAVDNVGHAPP